MRSKLPVMVDCHISKAGQFSKSAFFTIFKTDVVEGYLFHPPALEIQFVVEPNCFERAVKEFNSM